MKREMLNECPVCGASLTVKELECPGCHTIIRGSFIPSHSRLFKLSSKDLQFVELFVRLRGNIREVEKALGVSYPTVRGMLEKIISKMGYPVRSEPTESEKHEIIEKLERGQITAKEAARMLKGETVNKNQSVHVKDEEEEDESQ